jgi:hypothetical protein
MSTQLKLRSSVLISVMPAAAVLLTISAGAASYTGSPKVHKAPPPQADRLVAWPNLIAKKSFGDVNRDCLVLPLDQGLIFGTPTKCFLR